MTSFNNIKELTKSQRKVIRAWCMYDWANSGFATSGIAAIYPIYFVYLFKEALGEKAVFWGMTFTGSSVWSLSAVVAASIVAISSPILGIIADRVPIKKTLLWIYTIAGCIFTILAFFSAYTATPWAWLIGTFILANIGFAGSLVFYNAFLPHIAPRELADDVSSRGYAYGYIGGGLLLLIHLAINVVTSGTAIEDTVTRLLLSSIGLWWFLWALWTFRGIPEPEIENPISGLNILSASKLAKKELKTTFAELKNFKVIVLYLAAYLLFNDGIQSILGIAGAFAADTLGLALTFNMATILIIQFVAAGGAILFSKIARITSTKKSLTISLIGWVFIVILGVSVAPLVPSSHSEHDYQISYNSRTASYTINKSPELSDSKTELLWGDEVADLLNQEYLNPGELENFVTIMSESDNSKFSASIKMAEGNERSIVGPIHPSSLENGPLDWWPSLIRKFLWEPLNIAAGYQWLILGVNVGLVMGGSQALARSLFSQISPETRSGEFFSFFGFMSRASSVLGPIIYVLVTGMLDTRSAVFAILLLIVAGTAILQLVDVKKGILIAQEEDSKKRLEKN